MVKNTRINDLLNRYTDRPKVNKMTKEIDDYISLVSSYFQLTYDERENLYYYYDTVVINYDLRQKYESIVLSVFSYMVKTNQVREFITNESIYEYIDMTFKDSENVRKQVFLFSERWCNDGL